MYKPTDARRVAAARHRRMILVILRCWRLLLLPLLPCEILLRSDFPSLFVGLIWGWTSVLKADDLIFLSFGKPSAENFCISLEFIGTPNIATNIARDTTDPGD